MTEKLPDQKSEKPRPIFVEINPRDAATLPDTPEGIIDFKRELILEKLGKQAAEIALEKDVIGVAPGYYDRESGRTLPPRMVRLGNDFGTVVLPETYAFPSVVELEAGKKALSGEPEVETNTVVIPEVEVTSTEGQDLLSTGSYVHREYQERIPAEVRQRRLRLPVDEGVPGGFRPPVTEAKVPVETMAERQRRQEEESERSAADDDYYDNFSVFNKK